MSHAVVALFGALMVALPFAEWRFIGLPISGRPLRISLDEYLSISLFDVLLIPFAFAIAPAGVRMLRRVWRAPLALLPVVLCAVLAGWLFVDLRPSLPFLTPVEPNVVDVRGLAMNLVLMGSVAVFVAHLKIRDLVFGGAIYSSYTAVGAIVLVALALLPFGYFRFHYPFADPAVLVFPFPSQGLAAGFFAMACIWALAIATAPPWRVLGASSVAILLLAVAMTGTRSAFSLLCAVAAGFVAVSWRQTRLRGARNGLVWPVMGLMVGAALVAYLYDWRPVQRSVSIFADVTSRPLDLLGGGSESSARRALWSLTMRGDEGLDDAAKRATDDYFAFLLVVESGCKRLAPPIGPLRSGAPYRIALTNGAGSYGQAELAVDGPEIELRQVAVPLEGMPRMPRAALFMAHSGRDYLTFAGSLSGFRILGGTTGSSVFTAASSFEEPFNGANTPAFKIARDKVVVHPKNQLLRGYTEAPLPAELASGSHVLEFDVELELPRDQAHTPALLLAGFYEPATSRAWTDVSNAVFVYLERALDSTGRRQAYARDVEWIHSLLATVPRHTELTDRQAHALVAARIRCNDGASHGIHDIHRRLPSREMVTNARTDVFNASVRRSLDARAVDVLSTVPRPDWDAASYLQGRGSTHNAYLDLFRYAGAYAALLYILVLASLVILCIQGLRRATGHGEFSIWLAVGLQVCFIAAFTYVQPYLLARVHWLVFGIAVGLTLSKVNHVHPPGTK